ncbi:MAG: hypothetical protein JSW28_04220, partial [Thermoplasmata archaeon]
IGGILFINSFYIKPKQNECNNLSNQFEQLRNSEAGSTRADISVRSLHSQKVVNMLTEPLTSLEGYWYNNVQGIGWVSSDLKDQLTRQLHGIPSMPPPLSNLPPPDLVKVQ